VGLKEGYNGPKKLHDRYKNGPKKVTTGYNNRNEKSYTSVGQKKYIAYKTITPAPKSLLGLQDKSKKIIARTKKNIP